MHWYLKTKPAGAFGKSIKNVQLLLPGSTFHTARLSAGGGWFLGASTEWPGVEPPDVELGAGWDACIASLGRPAAQDGIKALMAGGFHKPGDVEDRLGYYLTQIPR